MHALRCNMEEKIFALYGLWAGRRGRLCSQFAAGAAISLIHLPLCAYRVSQKNVQIEQNFTMNLTWEGLIRLSLSKKRRTNL